MTCPLRFVFTKKTVMPFKLKHIVRGPAKVMNAVGQSGIFGQRGEHFRILGVKIGKDLVPVVQAAVVAATVATATPVVASTLGVSETTATVIATTGANTFLTGVSGGSESDVLETMAKGIASGMVGHVVQNVPSIVGKVATHIIGNTAVEVAMGTDTDKALVKTAASSVALTSTEKPTLMATNAIAGAILDENSLRGAMQSVAKDIIKETINNTISNPSKKTNKEPNTANEEPNTANKEPNTANKEPTTEPVTNIPAENALGTAESIQTTDMMGQPESIPPNIYTEVEFGHGIGVTVGGKNSPFASNLTKNSVGLSSGPSGLSERTSSNMNIGVSDIYENGIVVDKQFSISNGVAEHSNSVSSVTPLQEVANENIGTCISTREVISLTATNDLHEPEIKVTTSNQTHFNVDCAQNAAKAAVVSAAIVMLPEVTLPVMMVQKLAN